MQPSPRRLRSGGTQALRDKCSKAGRSALTKHIRGPSSGRGCRVATGADLGRKGWGSCHVGHLTERCVTGVRGRSRDSSLGLPTGKSADPSGMPAITASRRLPPQICADALRAASRDYRSSGVRPVCLAMRASMRGPISSPSWNEKTKSGRLGWERIRWEPAASRLTRQPIWRRAART
jgi:hypothetical protein